MDKRSWLAGLLLSCVVVTSGAAFDLERRDYAMAETVYRSGNYGDAYLKLLPLAQANNSSAQFLIGRMSDNGLGPVQLDPDEAFRWYLKAARNGSGAGQFAVAKAYAAGRGVMASPQHAMDWLKKAAASDYVPAILSLASLYQDGRGIDKDPATAAILEHHAAELGSPEAQYRVGERLHAGHDVAEDQKAAAEWFGRAAAAGHPGALYRLAQIATVNPEATPAERIQGFVYMTLASQRGSDEVKRDASQELKAIRTALAPDQLIAAQGQLRNWKPSPQTMQFAAPGDDNHDGMSSAAPVAPSPARSTAPAPGKQAKTTAPKK